MPDDGRVERVIEADASCTLYELIFCLLNSIDFDFDHMYEFQIRKTRYSGSPMGSEGEDPRLDSLGLRRGSRFRLIYDFGDDWTFDIVVSGRREGSVERGTKVIASIGEVEQYPDFEDWEEDYENPDDPDYEALSPEAKEITDQLEEFELQLFNDDEAAAADLMLEIWPKIKQYVLSLPELAAASSQSAQDGEKEAEEGKPTIDEADPDYRMGLWNALMDSDLPFLNLKRYEEGLRLWDDILQTFRWEGNDGDELRGAIGEALAGLGEKEKMAEHFLLWEGKSPNSSLRMNSHLLALEKIKDWEAAKERLETYLEAVNEDIMKELLFQRAVEIYEALGDEEKADYYSGELERLEEEIENEMDELNAGDEDVFFPFRMQSTVMRSEPKIYPNDPCPCGSGKKYKKCCGKNR
ncbi:MAG: plasmid pRiA4b ORF-3 family protein [Lachnospiraceae bacterium]|nr:plasmid pRiA4b ORF-3 family protein [Lachnospiraceae bacterium]